MIREKWRQSNIARGFEYQVMTEGIGELRKGFLCIQERKATSGAQSKRLGNGWRRGSLIPASRSGRCFMNVHCNETENGFDQGQTSFYLPLLARWISNPAAADQMIFSSLEGFMNANGFPRAAEHNSASISTVNDRWTLVPNFSQHPYMHGSAQLRR